MAGAVLVHENKIIAQGVHRGFGQVHAERDLLLSFGEEIPSGAILYVNLEPCCHQGKTPPCTDIILERGVKRVCFGMRDPDSRVSGKGIEVLRSAGVEVIGPTARASCERFNRGFVSVRTKGRPWVTLKKAMTKDGRIANEDGSTLKITSEEQDCWAHTFLRSRHDAILVGAETVVRDDPKLDVRRASAPFPQALPPAVPSSPDPFPHGGKGNTEEWPDPYSKIPVHASVLHHARKMRKNPTPAELKLWEELRDNKLGCWFRRQHPIGCYILDFYCNDFRLGIEIDGSIHDDPEQRKQDEERTAALEEIKDVTLLRFSNDQVLQDLPAVLQTIKEQLTKAPPLMGEGMGVREKEGRAGPEVTTHNTYQPWRIILDPSLRIPLDAQVVTDEARTETIIITDASRAGSETAELLRGRGVRVFGVPASGGRFDLPSLWRVLTTPTEDFHGLTSILVEGGARTWQICMDAGVVDEEIMLIGS